MHIAPHLQFALSVTNPGQYRIAASAILDRDGRLVEIQTPHGVTHPFGIARERLQVGRSLSQLCEESGHVALAEAIAGVTDGSRSGATVRYAVDIGNRSRTWETTVTGISQEDRMLVCAFDVTDLDHALGDLSRRASVDELTGVGNRGAAIERIALDLRGALPVAALLVDVDHLKFINDSLGHDAGDTVLRQIATRLAKVVDEDGLVARLGGDEFLVLRELASASDARELAEALRAAVRAPVDVKGKQMKISASIGVAFSAESHRRPEDLLRDADVALYLAKSLGRDQVAVFSAHERERVAHAVRIESELRDALASGSLTIAVQPIIDVHHRTIVGGEALVRWPLTNGAVRSPLDFLDVASESGLIADIDLFVLDAACAALERFREEMDAPPQFISTNVSIAMLAHDDFVDILTDTAGSHGLTPDALLLEIPETVLAREHASAQEKLDVLREAGAFVALDDFGTGWSSLGALRSLPVDVLKIDKSFVRGLGVDPNDTAIVTSILSLAQAMGLHVVAEGVESWPQVAELARLGCPVMQGFRLARPVAVERFASASAWVLDAIPDRRGLTRAAVGQEKTTWRGQATFIDEFLHQLNVPRRSVS